MSQIGEEHRTKNRYWAAPGTAVEFSYQESGIAITEMGSLRDISEGGCLVVGLQNTKRNGVIGPLILRRRNTETTAEATIEAEISRAGTNCVAFRFTKSVPPRKFFSDKKKVMWDFVTTNDKALSDLAALEIKSISDDIRMIKECQVRVLLTCLTLTVSFAVFVVALLQFRASAMVRSCVSLAPALLAIVCGLIGLGKGATLNRAESFLLLLKQQVCMGAMPIGYFGWEDALSRLHNNCNYLAEAKKQLGRIPKGTQLQSQSRLFAGIAVGAYGLIYLASVLGFFLQIPAATAGPHDFMFAFLLIFVMVCIVGAIILGRQVRSGSLSAITFLYAWATLLSDPAPFHPDNLYTKSMGE